MASQFPSTRAPQHSGASAPRLKVLSIVGARSQFIRAAPVGKALRAAGYTEVLVQTGQHYNELLAGLPVTTPYESPDGYHVYHQYTIRAPQRDALAAYLKERGVGTMIYYPVPLHLQGLYASLGYGEGSLPVSEAASREVLSLPMYPELTEEQQVMVAEAIRGFYGLRRTTNPSALRQRSGQAWLRTGVGRSLDADDG